MRPDTLLRNCPVLEVGLTSVTMVRGAFLASFTVAKRPVEVLRFGSQLLVGDLAIVLI